MLRDGHAARLRLRRRPRRGRDEGDRRRRREGRLPRLVGLRRLDQGAVRRDDQGDGARAGRGGRGAAAQSRTTRRRSCSTRRRPSATSTGRRETPLEEGVAKAVDYYRDARRRRDVHAPEAGRADERAVDVGRERTPTSSSSAAPASSARNLVRAAARARRAARSSSSTTCSRPSARTCRTIARVELVEGSIADDAVLAQLGDEFDYVFHLATYHGNQSSIANPLEDHANNLITTLKLYERLKGSRRLRKLVYSASGCTLARARGLRRGRGDAGGRAGAARPRQPVPDLQGRRRVLLGLLPPAGGPADRARALPERLRPGRDPRRRQWRGTVNTVWRNVTPTFVYRALKGLPLRSTTAATRAATSSTSTTSSNGLLLCATDGAPGDVYNLASGVETTIRELAELVNELSGSDVADRASGRGGRGTTRSSASAARRRRERELGFEAKVELRDGLERTVEWTRDEHRS